MVTSPKEPPPVLKQIVHSCLDPGGGHRDRQHAPDEVRRIPLNDVLPPFVLLDNMPCWEYGVLTELRDTVRAMRNDLGRAQSQSVEHLDLVTADAQFHFSPESWMLPSTVTRSTVVDTTLNGPLC